jgi:hypothetical protein
MLSLRRSRQDKTTPVVDKVSEVPDNAEAPLGYKRNRQDGDSGATFQTTPVEKYLNTLRVYLNSRRV